MNTKKFAMIEEPLSAVGLGCWGFSGGESWSTGNDQQSIDTVHAAIDAGINVFDDAPIYGLGHAEKILGKASQGKRDKMFIASKCGMIWDENNQVSLDLSRSSIFSEVERSLMRLKTDYIDLYQMHWPDNNTLIEDSLEALLELRKQGKIRYIGLTNYALKNLNIAFDMDALHSVQGLYNLLEHNPTHYHNIPLAYRTRNDILPFCKQHGVAFLPYSPLMQGLLTGDFDPSSWSEDDVRQPNPKFHGELWVLYKELAEEVANFASQLNHPMSQVAINWLIAQEGVGPIISGSLTPDHVKQNTEATQWSLTPTEFEQLDAIIATKLTNVEAKIEHDMKGTS